MKRCTMYLSIQFFCHFVRYLWNKIVSYALIFHFTAQDINFHLAWSDCQPYYICKFFHCGITNLLDEQRPQVITVWTAGTWGNIFQFQVGHFSPVQPQASKAIVMQKSEFAISEKLLIFFCSRKSEYCLKGSLCKSWLILLWM